MKKFYETYVDDEFVTTLLSQISWSNHLAIISKGKTLYFWKHPPRRIWSVSSWKACRNPKTCIPEGKRLSEPLFRRAVAPLRFTVKLTACQAAKVFWRLNLSHTIRYRQSLKQNPKMLTKYPAWCISDLSWRNTPARFAPDKQNTAKRLRQKGFYKLLMFSLSVTFSLSFPCAIIISYKRGNTIVSCPDMAGSPIRKTAFEMFFLQILLSFHLTSIICSLYL